MLVLKIKDKGLYLEIPGMPPTRTPAEIDISKCDLSVVLAHLRMNGISDYQILSISKPICNQNKAVSNIKKDSSNEVDERFSRLEELMDKLLEKELENSKLKKEQITDKLNNIEKLSKQILEKRESGEVTSIEKIKSEPELEELEDQFIPSIDTSGLKMKSNSKKVIKQDVDLDDSVDLLSRIMGQEDK